MKCLGDLPRILAGSVWSFFFQSDAFVRSGVGRANRANANEPANETGQ
jgi:hypothetical protein